MSDFRDPFDTIKDHPFDDALSQRYLVYALSTITARSLPDLRDGLKPVHRRLLWAMRLLRMEPGGASPEVMLANPSRNTTSYKKCARVVGDVIGKYHPHGDASVYDAMVRLAQDFSLRMPLVDGQGNFGNIDGDNAAAMRYTEARLTQAAADLMAGLDEGTVDFRPTYNGEE
ncbi:MAG: DNA topoisomerase IV subunit A, partial [Sphingobium sp. 32-64-5]